MTLLSKKEHFIAILSSIWSILILFDVIELHKLHDDQSILYDIVFMLEAISATLMIYGLSYMIYIVIFITFYVFSFGNILISKNMFYTNFSAISLAIFIVANSIIKIYDQHHYLKDKNMAMMTISLYGIMSFMIYILYMHPNLDKTSSEKMSTDQQQQSIAHD